MNPTRKAFMALTVAATAAVSLAVAPIASASSFNDPEIGAAPDGKTSKNWSGYSLESATANTYKTAAATWTVPTVSPSPSGLTAQWVGIDGAAPTDRYLTQTGTTEAVLFGQVVYEAWWEVITPDDTAPSVSFNMTISAGDSITASVSDADGQTTLTLTDNTTGASQSHTSDYAGPGETVEWISEAPATKNFLTGKYYISTSPNFGTVPYTGLTANGEAPGIKAGDRIDLVDTKKTVEIQTGLPNDTGDGFTSTWLAAGTKTPINVSSSKTK